MRIRTENEVKEFNAALDRCTSSVWLMGPGEEYNMKNEGDYAQGMARLMGGNADQLGIFTTSNADLAVMMDICQKLAA